MNHHLFICQEVCLAIAGMQLMFLYERNKCFAPSKFVKVLYLQMA